MIENISTKEKDVIDRLQIHSRNFFKAKNPTDVYARVEGKSPISDKTIYEVQIKGDSSEIYISAGGNVVEPKNVSKSLLMSLDGVSPIEALALSEALIEEFE